MKYSKLSLVLATVLAAPFAYAIDVGTNGNPDARTVTNPEPANPSASTEGVKHHAQDTLNRKADVNPRDAGGSNTASRERYSKGTHSRADVNERNAGGTTERTAGTTTRNQVNDTTTVPMSQSSVDRTRTTTETEYSDTSNGRPFVILGVLALIAIAIGFGVHTYRQRHPAI